MNIVTYHAPDVPLGLYSRLSKLTLGEEGLMWNAFKDCGKGGMIGRVHIAYVDNRIRGWSLRWRYPSERGWYLYLYVQPEYRQQGIASALAHQAIRYTKKEGNVKCFPWDESSNKFFERLYNKSNKVTLLF